MGAACCILIAKETQGAERTCKANGGRRIMGGTGSHALIDRCRGLAGAVFICLVAVLLSAGPAVAQNTITLTKTPYTTAGQVITYTYVVTRNGTANDVDLNSINDNKVLGINCPII